MEQLLSILIVEDDPIDAHSVRKLLGKSGIGQHVDSATSMEQAKQKVRQIRYDAVILDLGLPDSNGIDGIIDFQATAPELPIIVLTGLQDDKTALRSIDLGAEDFIDKNSVTEESLSRSIRFAIERHRRKQQVFGDMDTMRQTLDHARLKANEAPQGSPITPVPFSVERLVQSVIPIRNLDLENGVGNRLIFGLGSSIHPESELAIRDARAANQLSEVTLHCLRMASEWRHKEAPGSSLHLDVEADAIMPWVCTELLKIFRREEDRVNCVLFFHTGFSTRPGGVSPADFRMLRQSGFQIGVRKVGDGSTNLENLQLLAPGWVRFDGVLTNHVSRYKKKAEALKQTMDMLRPLGVKWAAEETSADDDLRQLREFGFSCFTAGPSAALETQPS